MLDARNLQATEDSHLKESWRDLLLSQVTLHMIHCFLGKWLSQREIKGYWKVYFYINAGHCSSISPLLQRQPFSMHVCFEVLWPPPSNSVLSSPDPLSSPLSNRVIEYITAGLNALCDCALRDKIWEDVLGGALGLMCLELCESVNEYMPWLALQGLQQQWRCVR